MGEIVGVGLVSHVPTIMLEPDIRRELNEGDEISLVPRMHRLKAEALTPLGERAVVSGNIDDLVNLIPAQAQAGEHIVCMSNGGFGGIHNKLLAGLENLGEYRSVAAVSASGVESTLVFAVSGDPGGCCLFNPAGQDQTGRIGGFPAAAR